MMSSGKARLEKAELERLVKRRPQGLQRKRWPPSSVVPSFVTITELHRGHDIDMSSYALSLPAPLRCKRTRRPDEELTA
jgi:hypothetical protein